MSDTGLSGVLYTEYPWLRAHTPLLSLWAYRSWWREPGRPAVARSADGGQEYWLDRSDPLLNTMLPGTPVSVVVNLRDAWAAGRTLVSSERMPPACVIGALTRPRVLRVGRRVHAVGVVLPAALSHRILGCPAGDLVDQIVPLGAVWPSERVERLLATLRHVGTDIGRLSMLRDEVVSRLTPDVDPVGAAASLIAARGGDASVEALAAAHEISRQQFTRRFRAATGLPPRQFARICRFQRLLQALLTTDVNGWASAASRLGFYDQAHMINDFREFTGEPPTRFFQPHSDDHVVVPAPQLRGRPHEWLRPGDST